MADLGTRKPAIDTDYFPNTKSSSYWSSTTDAHDGDYAWLVYFNYGNDYDYGKSSSYYVRAVRSGQGWSLDDLVISAPEQGAVWGVGNTQEIVWNDEGIPGTVNIKLSRQGGTEGTYETIIATTENDGSYHWTVTGPGSENCTLKIVPSDPYEQYPAELKWTTSDIFTIDSSYSQGWIDKGLQAPLHAYTFSAYGSYALSGTVSKLPIEASANYTLSDPALGTFEGNVLSAQGTGRVLAQAELQVPGVTWPESAYQGQALGISL